MGRKPRVEYQGGLYHIIQRGNNREYIFKKDEDKVHLRKLVKDYKGVLDCEIYRSKGKTSVARSLIYYRCRQDN